MDYLDLKDKKDMNINGRLLRGVEEEKESFTEVYYMYYVKAIIKQI
jgi:hypothetical protein